MVPTRAPRKAAHAPAGTGLAHEELLHAAFDRHILGVRPDLTVELRPDVLREPDGSMLKCGLQGFQDARLLVPRDPALRPNREFVEERYGMFRRRGRDSLKIL